MWDRHNNWFKASWRGEVSDTDLQAQFASTERLSQFHQALDDRRLAAEIEQAGQANQDWRAMLAVGPIAAPLWLAESLVELANCLYEAERQAHPDTPGLVNAATHALVEMLLAPVEALIAEVAASLADPTRQPALTNPWHIWQRRNGEAIAVPSLSEMFTSDFIAALASVQGLTRGARHVHTSAAMALLGEQRGSAPISSIPSSPPAVSLSPPSTTTSMSSPDIGPTWWKAGTQQLNGDLQAADARLDMIERRLESFASRATGRHGKTLNAVDSATLAAMYQDLWGIVDTTLTAGQMIANPLLLPEASKQSREQIVRHSTVSSPLPPASYQELENMKDAVKRPQRQNEVLPQIEEGATALALGRAAALDSGPTNAPTPPAEEQAEREAKVERVEATLPTIGEAGIEDEGVTGVVPIHDAKTNGPAPAVQSLPVVPPAISIRFPEIGNEGAPLPQVSKNATSSSSTEPPRPTNKPTP